MAKTEDVALLRLLNDNPDLFLCEGARRSLLEFARYTDPKFIASQFHRSYYCILDRFAKGDIKRLIVQCPPQTGKSTGSSRNLPAFMLGRNPDLRIGLASYAATIAQDFNRDVQRIIDTPEYHRVFPDTSLQGGMNVVVKGNYVRNNDVFEIVGHHGSLRAVGRGGSLTSKTIDMAILDDLYKDAGEANSPLIRQRTWDWFTKVVMTRLHNDSQILIVFTRWHKDDVIGRLMDSENVVEIRKWSDIDGLGNRDWALVNFEAIKTGEPTELDARERGEVLWPERHSLERMEAQRALDPVGFQCLYQGNPGNAEGRLYTAFKTWVDKSDWGTYVRSGNYTDVADEGNDWLASVCYDVYISDNQMWDESKRRWVPIIHILITDMVFTADNVDVTTVTVPDMINRNGTQRAWIESNNGGSQFEKTVKRKVKAITVPFYQGANKESRIVTNAPFVCQSVVMPFGWETRFPIAYKHLTEFLREFDANDHDDIEDCLTGIYEKEVADGNTRPYNGGGHGVKVH